IGTANTGEHGSGFYNFWRKPEGVELKNDSTSPRVLVALHLNNRLTNGTTRVSRAVVLTTERSGHTRDSPRGFTADKAATPRRPSSTRTPNRLTTYRDFSSHGARPRLTVFNPSVGIALRASS